MSGTPSATIKDLLSTGYFYEELTSYIKATQSQEIDLISFNRDFAVPYLTRKFESCKGPGKTYRTGILKLAVKFLNDVGDADVSATIFALKKLAEAEVDTNEKEICTSDQPASVHSCRKRSESAQLLKKLLTSMIKMFKLPQITSKRDAPDERQIVEDTVKSYWELSMLPAMKSLPL